MGASKEFRKALEGSKDAKARLQKAKKARPGTGFSLPEIEDGSYITRVTCEGNKTKDGTPFVNFKCMVLEGDYKKVSVPVTFFLKGKKGDDPKRVQMNWDFLSQAIQTCAGIGEEELEDFENWELSELCDILDEIDESAPVVKIGVKNVEGKPTGQGKDKKPGKRYLQVFFNELLEDYEEKEGDEEEKEEEDEESDEEDSDDSEEDEDGDEGNEDDEEGDEDDSEEEESVVISKGDNVFYTYKKKGAKKGEELVFSVTASSKKDETCSLTDVETEKIKLKDIAWADCTPAEEDSEEEEEEEEAPKKRPAKKKPAPKTPTTKKTPKKKPSRK